MQPLSLYFERLAMFDLNFDGVVMGVLPVQGGVAAQNLAEQGLVYQPDIPGSPPLKLQQDLVGQSDIPGSPPLKFQQDILIATDKPGSPPTK
jgi:hypothetical protein